MSRRPIVSYGGDCSLFCGLQGSLVAALPEETVEWRRSYGRTSRFVNIEVDFVPFSEECLVKDPSRSVLQQPIFHTYWTDCTDVESYKSSVRDSVQCWVTELRQNSITDWMVVVVGAPDAKKTNKLLPRTTVLDKMKADFGGKQAERCVSLYEPVKTDSRSMESWQALLAKMRSLIMVAYNRALNKFEESMRAERERRTDKSWSFCSYFRLQEELAEVMQLLGVPDEALVQYDELDALLTQFVLNSAAGDTPLWLANFRQTCSRWEGLCLNGEPDRSLQEKLSTKSISLLELRNYLFQQQAALLLTLNKHWELAGRALGFLQNTGNELHILQISIAPGGVACWGFLSCLEVIHTLSRFNLPNTTHAHARHSAPLWAYARDKLRELGKLCGLQPGDKESSSEQLHTVIALVCGMGNDPHADNTGVVQGSTKQSNDADDRTVIDGNLPSKKPLSKTASVLEKESFSSSVVPAVPGNIDAAVSFGVAILEQDHMTPMTRLKEALSSKEAFRKHYLELSEVAISTYKHIGHVRSARLIGRDLASFYLSLGQPQQAANFLSDLLHSFADGGCWPLLVADTRSQLQTCYRAMHDWPKFVRVSAELSCCTVLPETVRQQAFADMIDALQDLKQDETVTLSSSEMVSIDDLVITSDSPVTLGSTLCATATLHSTLPASISFESIEIILKLQSVEEPPHSASSSGSASSGARKRSSDNSARLERKVSGVGNPKQQQHHHPATVNRSNSGGSESSESNRSEKRSTIPEEDEDGGSDGDSNGRLHMSLHLDYKQDNTLATAAVVCYNAHIALSRRDSHSRLSASTEQLMISRESSDTLLSVTDVHVPPGTSTVQLKAQVTQKGVLVCKGAVLRSKCLELIQNKLPQSSGNAVQVEVLQQSHRLVLGKKGRDLVAGLSQPLLLTLHAGTTAVDKDTAIELRTSRGLLLSPTVWQLREDGGKVAIETTTSLQQSVEGSNGAPMHATVCSSDDVGAATEAAAVAADITAITDSAAVAAAAAVVASVAGKTDNTYDGNALAEEMADVELVRELRLLCPRTEPLTSLTLELTVLALLGPQRDTNAVDHIISVSSPVLQQNRQDVDIHFSPPFCSVAKLHTAHTKKFFQVKVNGLVGENIELSDGSLSIQQPSSPSSTLSLTPINTPDQTMVVCCDQWGSYMWEVGVDYTQPSCPPLKLEFGVQYWTQNIPPHTVRTYRCTFDLQDYKTVFSIKSRVEPSKGSEFCRAGSMCHLHITVEGMAGATPQRQDTTEHKSDCSEKQSSSTGNSDGGPSRKVSGGGGCGDNYDSIMYEVLADQTMWAVCGRTSGVLSVECAKRRQNVTLDVMPLMGGFLPLPSVRLSKYIPADIKRPDSVVGTASSIPRLEPFSPGQVYNMSKGSQVHVLTAVASNVGAANDSSLH